MADKMMRLAGRSDDGTAKALSVELDDTGNGVLRVVDAAPFAYDPVDDVLKVNQKAYPLLKNKYTLTIPASGFADAILNLDVSGYSSITVGVSGGAVHNFKVQVYQQDYEDVIVLEKTTTAFTSVYEAMTSVIPVKATGTRVRIYNDDTVNPHTYTVFIYLRK